MSKRRGPVVLRRQQTNEVAAKLLPHLRSLYNFAVQLAGRGEAEDLVQATVLKAIEHWAELTPRQNIRAWLFIVLRNAWIDAQREQSRRVAAAGRDRTCTEPEPARGPEELAVEQQWALEIRRAVENLPEVYRFPVYLRDVEGLSYKEIAEILGCPIGTVMSRLARGRALLRAQLLGQLEDRGWGRNRKTGTEGHEL
ncbi:MAG: sigma-70 family RNA polymerase sigma factor [Candidatus Binatia bacterium]|nr:sigma-70 family RNA polymerase sigma factor [Candidatus Binatia bacterium]